MDDRLRADRGITTDSPAASRKVFMMARAVAKQGIKTLVMSMGRGRADRSGRYFPAQARRSVGVATLYLPFSHNRLLSPLYTLLAPVLALWRLRGSRGATTVVFYNALPAYLPALVTARLLGFRTVLDLEDGATYDTGHVDGAVRAAASAMYEALCSRALLACTALKVQTRLRPAAPYYGVVEPATTVRNWNEPTLNVLFGGTLAADTGADLLIATVMALRKAKPAWARGLAIQVSGKGSALARLSLLADGSTGPSVVVHGRLAAVEYDALIASCHVGLSLKPKTGPLATTTFPSKIVEYAGAGMLVLATETSDVRELLQDGARYLESDAPAALAAQLQEIVEDRSAAAATAATGTANASKQCLEGNAGAMLAGFLFGPDR